MSHLWDDAGYCISVPTRRWDTGQRLDNGRSTRRKAYAMGKLGQRAVPDPPETYILPIFQLHGERSRVVVTGVRTDDGDRCELVVITDTGGSVAFYPHGATRLGVRVEEATAVRVARAILAAADGH
ncbi:MAG: hypothetical protein LC749_01540 [Actinobacteria bacterium]|nr:hypothetical protein [Actinomycetota bacterium]